MTLLLGLAVGPAITTAVNADVCLVAPQGAESETVDCDLINPQAYPNAVTGFDRLASFCAVEYCGPVGTPSVPYGWSISSSSTDSRVNSGLLSEPEDDLFLWLNCTAIDGFSAASFDLEVTAVDLRLLSVTPMNGVLNFGTGPELRLAVGGCPQDVFLAAKLTLAVDDPDSVEPGSWGRVKAMHR